MIAVPLSALLAATWRLPRLAIARESGGWRAKMPFVAKDLRRAFATAAITIVSIATFVLAVAACADVSKIEGTR
jgi:hypothetical protein